MKKDQVVILEKRGVILISGNDADDFLQNIITNDIKKVSNENSIFTFDIQLEQTSIFERWSMPIRDSFDDVLANADYVANEFS